MVEEDRLSDWDRRYALFFLALRHLQPVRRGQKSKALLRVEESNGGNLETYVDR